MKPPIDISGEIAVQLLECELIRERSGKQVIGHRVRELREAIELGRKIWSVPL